MARPHLPASDLQEPGIVRVISPNKDMLSVAAVAVCPFLPMGPQ